jgi:hypothetical protein
MRPVALFLVCAGLSLAAEDSGRIYVTSVAATLVDNGLAAPPPTDVASFHEVTAPGVGSRRGQAQATEAPWLDLNGWRYERGLRKANYAKLPPGSAPLAAAEAFTYGVEAILNPDAADVEELGRMLQFVKERQQPRLPAMANIAVEDDGSPLVGEVLNLLTRRNLLYRVVSAPDRSLLNVRVGSTDFPREVARNPSDFAARVREKIGDDNRLLRVYGSSTVVARLTGDRTRTRLFLLAYGGRRGQARAQQHVRIRLLGHYEPVALAAYGSPQDARLLDVEHPGNTTEFTLPGFNTLAIVDLKPSK